METHGYCGREQIATTEMPVNEAVAAVGSEKLRAARLLSKGLYKCLCGNVDELFVRSHWRKRKKIEAALQDVIERTRGLSRYGYLI